MGLFIYGALNRGQDSVRRLEGHEDCVTSVKVSPDGRQIASSSRDGAISTMGRCYSEQLVGISPKIPSLDSERVVHCRWSANYIRV